MGRKMEATQEYGGAVTSLQARFFLLRTQSLCYRSNQLRVPIFWAASYLACLSGLKLASGCTSQLLYPRSCNLPVSNHDSERRNEARWNKRETIRLQNIGRKKKRIIHRTFLKFKDYKRVFGPGIESRWGRNFPPVQTGPGTHPTSCTMGTGSFPGVKCGRGVLLTTHPLLAPRSWKRWATPLPPPPFWATTGPVTGLFKK